MELLYPVENDIDRAVEILKKGGIVAFPTETVYGIGCDAFNEKAVERLYEIKKRSRDKPLIVGVGSFEEIYEIAEVNEVAEILIKEFFPGSLTLVLKNKKIPSIVTANSQKVAVRMPSHEIPLKLIRKLGRPVVVPSANISGRPSPTKFEHVLSDFGESIDAIIIGECQIGIESTILDVTVSPPKLLRPGAVSTEALKKFVDLEVGEDTFGQYEISAEVLVFTGRGVEEEIKKFLAKRKNAVVIAKKNIYGERVIEVGETLESYAMNFFDALRKAESMGAEVILVEGIEEKGIGEAIMHRLYRCARNVIRV
ncbi:MAG: L-threonylcarbamoyladenylate synthase [Archaeoglobaceae archaeon]|nr:L-threonylcarbamoyladenylate synthase [Archaeoglobaceae archaeon]MDW8127595.1 L-threonylcarbamoyladenylate synthase [Archaeoglobaceae archaeon]